MAFADFATTRPGATGRHGCTAGQPSRNLPEDYRRAEDRIEADPHATVLPSARHNDWTWSGPGWRRGRRQAGAAGIVTGAIGGTPVTVAQCRLEYGAVWVGADRQYVLHT